MLSLLTEISGVMARCYRHFRDGRWGYREKRIEKAPCVDAPGAARYQAENQAENHDENRHEKPDTLLGPQIDVPRFYDAERQPLNARHSLMLEAYKSNASIRIRDRGAGAVVIDSAGIPPTLLLPTFDFRCQTQTIPKPTTIDEQRTESRFSHEARVFVQTRRVQKP